MNRTVVLKNIILGKGLPKIGVSIVGSTISSIVEEAIYIKKLDIDIVEWRVDFYDEVTNIKSVKEGLKAIREVLDDKPIIFTFRSVKEGGHKEISKEFYFELNKKIAETRLVEAIDIELFNSERDVKELVEAAHALNVAVIISNHDFYMTPPKEEIIARLRKAFELGGDIPKVAVMPTCIADVLTLLDATRIMVEEYAEGPIITISMNGMGLISRISGELFGSALTFGAAREPSAPGQISAIDLRKTIQLFHNNI